MFSLKLFATSVTCLYVPQDQQGRYAILRTRNLIEIMQSHVFFCIVIFQQFRYICVACLTTLPIPRLFRINGTSVDTTMQHRWVSNWQRNIEYSEICIFQQHCAHQISISITYRSNTELQNQKRRSKHLSSGTASDIEFRSQNYDFDICDIF